MRLIIVMDDHELTLDVPDFVMSDAEDQFSNMDKSFDMGHQMSHVWTEKPTTTQRCKIAADKLMNALHTDNEALAMMMAGYILSRNPGCQKVVLDNSGDMNQHEII